MSHAWCVPSLSLWISFCLFPGLVNCLLCLRVRCVGLYGHNCNCKCIFFLCFHSSDAIFFSYERDRKTMEIKLDPCPGSCCSACWLIVKACWCSWVDHCLVTPNASTSLTSRDVQFEKGKNSMERWLRSSKSQKKFLMLSSLNSAVWLFFSATLACYFWIESILFICSKWTVYSFGLCQ